jgi:transposase
MLISKGTQQRERIRKPPSDSPCCCRFFEEVGHTGNTRVVYPICCGIDVHKKIIVASIAKLQPDGTVTHDVQTFPVFNEDLIRLRDWLLTNNCHDVLMESTGKYWIPLLNVLEPYVRVQLTHPKYVRAIKGKKTDKNDAERISDLFMNDQVRSSFIPPKEIRDLRTLCRYRFKLVAMRCGEKKRYQDCMTVSNVTLAGVLSDSFGKSGTEIMEYVLSGQPIEETQLKTHIYGKARQKADDILKSVRGCAFDDAQKIKINLVKDHLEQLEAKIANVEGLMLQCTQNNLTHQVELLCTIPGIDKLAAVQILSEIGADMTVFETSKHLTSWAGLSPCNDESAGKHKSKRIARAGTYLKPLLIQCAWSAVRSKKEPYFATKFYRLVRRKEKKKAIVAIARMMLTCIYQMLSTGEVFNPVDLHTAQTAKRSLSLTEETAISFLAGLGYDAKIIRSLKTIVASG